MKLVLSSSCSPSLVLYPTTLAECCEEAKQYIEKHHIQNQQWSGGQVYLYDTYIGRISVTGIFWDKGVINAYGVIRRIK